MIIPQEAESAKRRYLLLSIAIVVVGMALSVAGWWLVSDRARSADIERFSRLADRVGVTLKERLILTETVLRAGRALFDASSKVTRVKWHVFYSDMRPMLADKTEGVNYVERVPREQLRAYLAQAQIESPVDFKLITSGDRPELDLIRYAEPSDKAKIGLDLGTEPIRRETLAQAMLTDSPIMTPLITFNATKKTGILLFFPVYSHGEVPTPAARRERLQGWFQAVIHPDIILDGLAESLSGQLKYEIYGGRDRLVPENLLFASESPLTAPTLTNLAIDSFQVGKFIGIRHFDRYGQSFTICTVSLPDFRTAASTLFPYSVLLGGSVVSLLAGWVFWSMGTTKSQAQKRAEAEARKLAQIASRTNNAVIIVDSSGKVEWVNQSFNRITGFSPTEAQGCEAAKFIIGPQSDPASTEEIRKSLQLGHTFRKEVLNQNKAGQPYWIDLEVQAVRDTTGRLSYNLIIGIDITERKQAEQELARKEAQFRFIFDSAPVGLAWIIVGYPESRLVNKAHMHITGVGLEAARSDADAYRKVTYPEDQVAQDELTARLMRGEIDVMSLEKRYLRPNGDLVWVMLTARHFPDLRTGQIHEVTTIVDITESRRQTDALRVAMKAAEQASIAKSQFLAMMSHEIRTPMNGVIGMTSLLLESPLTSEQREFIDTIRSSGDSLLVILNGILDFSKIEAGRLDLEKEVFSLRECVKGTLDLVSATAANKGLSLLHEIAAGTPNQVRGDINRLRQILVNLLNNAVKFTEHGEVVLTLTTASLDHGAIELHFAVRDTGIGIPAAAQERLFHSFSQVDASTTRKYGGTGLGLAISQRLAELMGGRMWVESEEGKGSTFHFTIHTEVVFSKPLSYLNGVRTHLTGKRMLIVGDNSTNRSILTTLAQNWGLAPRTADSGLAALQLIDSGETFDVGIIDMQMPGMDGVMFGREVQKRGRSEKLPMILLSSVGMHNAMTEGLFVTCLTKPAKPSQIFDAITRIFPWDSDGSKSKPPHDSTVETPAAVPTHAERLLLVEDNIVNQRVALHMLARLGYRADIAANGLEAIDAVRRQYYDLVLMDVQMPEMDGLESTKNIIKEFPLRKDRPWIIALTANAMQGDRELCLHAGMDDYITKPLRLAELSAALERARAEVVS